MHKHLNALLRRLDIRLRVFLTGNRCKATRFDTADGLGQLHILRSGELTLHGPDGRQLRLAEPSLIYFPRHSDHRMETDEHQSAELICASVESDAHFARALAKSLPTVVAVPLREIPGLDGVLEMMFIEAVEGSAGNSASFAQLGEIVLLHLIRWAVDRRLLTSGVVAGLADARLAKALAAIHNEPARPWKVGELADEAGLSRAHFAAQFSEVVGRPPSDYLAAWRIAIAQNLLSRGRQLKSIADECGYGSAGALSRAFVQHVGMRPTDWLAKRRPGFCH
jgi:AraC-like DNA-binding protein